MDGRSINEHQQNSIHNDAMTSATGMVNGVPNGHLPSKGQPEGQLSDRDGEGEEDAAVVKRSSANDAPSPAKKLMKSIDQLAPVSSSNAEEDNWPLPPSPEIQNDRSKSAERSKKHRKPPTHKESENVLSTQEDPQPSQLHNGQASHQAQSGQTSQRETQSGQTSQKDSEAEEHFHSHDGLPFPSEPLSGQPAQQKGGRSNQSKSVPPSQDGQWPQLVIGQPSQTNWNGPPKGQWSQPPSGQPSPNEPQSGQPSPGGPRYLAAELDDGYLRRVRSYCDVHDCQRGAGNGQETGAPGQPRPYSDVGQPDILVYNPPRNKRHSWAPQISIVEPEVFSGGSDHRSRFTVVPVRSQRSSYCGSPPSVHELDQYVVTPGGRSRSTGQAPNIYLLTPPEHSGTPFTFTDRDDGLRRSLESLTLSMGSQPNSPSLRPQNVFQIPTDSGQPMVLQLVLPQPQNTNNSGQGNSIAPSPQLEAITCPPITENYDNTKTVDTLQTASPTCTVSPSNSMNALVKPDGHNLYPQLTNGDQPTSTTVNGDAKNKTPLPPPSTSEEEKKTIFTKNLTTMLSSIYAIFIVMMGGVVYVADVLQPMKAYGEIFTIYLTIVGLAWLVFLHVDIRSYLNSLAIWRKQDKRRTLGRDNVGFDKSFDMVDKSEIKPSSSTTTLSRPPDSYCFKTGRHSGSFYLKIGAAVFCFGHLIHEGLLLSRQIAYFTSDQKYLNQCSDPIALILSILHPLFSFYQLFMVFKYSNIIINRYKEIARFAIMHIIAANLCLWVNTIIRETEEALAHKANHGNYSTDDDDDDDDDDDYKVFTTPISFIRHSVSSHDEPDSCVTKTILSAFTLQAAPYLYPFTIEYSLLQVGIWFVVWYNIGDNESIEAEKHHLRHSSGDDGTSTYEDVATGDSFTSNLVIHVDCHSANRGLFAGLFILLATVVSVIIFFVAMTNAQYIRTGVVINNVSDTVLLLLMIFSVAFAYRQTSNLDFNEHAVTFLDDFLLYIALPCFFLYAIFNVVASIAVNNPFTIVISVLCVIQVTIQTPFIVDGLRRCSNSYLMRFKKPGREIITFLIVCNVACWILETFEIKSYEAHADRIEFYGSFLWTLLSHVTLPLTLFYRFHSSVCLVDMWKSAYESGDSH